MRCLLYDKDIGITFFHTVGTCLPNCSMSHPIRLNLHVEAKYILSSIVTVSFSGKILYIKVTCHTLFGSGKLGLRGRSLLTACSVVCRDL